jgi:hypothetical protein
LIIDPRQKSKKALTEDKLFNDYLLLVLIFFTTFRTVFIVVFLPPGRKTS